jgi:hypothetical protein
MTTFPSLENPLSFYFPIVAHYPGRVMGSRIRKRIKKEERKGRRQNAEGKSRKA